IAAADGVSLYLGRASRVANREQRRALRVMYRGCAIPGCEARFADCDIHHLVWFRRLGLTDIDNLLPICHRHHHCVHEGGWHLALDTRRNLTITYPDGNIQTTGPPKTRPR
ncbi:MAG: HNH endonuclease signature motif containing protein, partial [Ilumatobacteraceae bacterium]